MKENRFGEFLEFGAGMSNELMTRMSREDKVFVLNAVTPKQLFVGGSFALLGVKAYEELGGKKHTDKVGPLGFLLSTVTKVDDEIIDREGISDAEIDRILENSRVALTEGRVIEETPVTRIAKSTHELLMSCNPPESALALWKKTINDGWKAQKDSMIQKRSLKVTSDEIRDISERKGDTFVFGVVMPGLMPEDSRMLTSAERDAIRRWGYEISRIDNLVDIPKDLRQGIVSEAVEHVAKDVPCMTDCIRNKRINNILTCIKKTGIDKHYILSEKEIRRIGKPLMNRVPSVHVYLSWLYGEWLKRFDAKNIGSLGFVEERVRMEIQGNQASDVHHIYRTLDFAREIQKKEGGDMGIIDAAVWLHDIGRERDDDIVTEGVSHGSTMTETIRKILIESGYDEPASGRICEVVSEHSMFGDKAPSSIEARILYDADKLDKLSTLGLVRGCLYLGANGKSGILDALMYAVVAIKTMKFNTKTGRKLARSRMREMETLLRWWQRDFAERDVPLGT